VSAGPKPALSSFTALTGGRAPPAVASCTSASSCCVSTSNQWREEQNRCQREIERHQNADKSYKDEGVALLDLARNAQRLFAMQEPREKRRLLNFVLSNCTWEDGDVVATFREPFDLLAQTATNSAQLGTGEESKSAKNEIWLPFLDTYRTMCRTPEPNFRQILEDVRALRFA
jgi:hypothetical protein